MEYFLEYIDDTVAFLFDREFPGDKVCVWTITGLQDGKIVINIQQYRGSFTIGEGPYNATTVSIITMTGEAGKQGDKLIKTTIALTETVGWIKLQAKRAFLKLTIRQLPKDLEGTH